MTKQEYKKMIFEEVYSNSCGIASAFKFLRIKVTNPQKLAIYYIRKMQYHTSQKGKIHSFFAQRYHMKLVKEFGMHVSPNARIGLGLHLPHPTGIVIGNSVVIGEKCTIYQGCTIGGARLGDVKKDNQPKVGNNCVLFSGSMLLGKITVVDGCIIAANSVLLKSAGEAGVYAGSPAKRVK